MCAALVVALLAMPTVADADVTDEDIQQAIDKGVAWLFAQQTDKGWFSTLGYFAYGGANSQPDSRDIGGLEAMAMMALTFAPVDIKTDERMKKGFEALLQFDMPTLYCRAPRVIVIARLFKKLGREQQERALAVLRADVDWIIKAQNKKGTWGYRDKTPETYGWDFSNTQMAILALSEADMAGLYELPKEPYERTQQIFLDSQRKDGGWNYGMRGGFQDRKEPNPDDPEIVPYVNGPYPNGSYGSMTAAGTATLFITRDFLYRGIGCPCKNGQSARPVAKLDESIDRGCAWLGKNFRPEKNPFGASNWNLYWLYSCERVGLAAGIKYFGQRDWYREGAREVVGSQRPDGSWSQSIPDTAYAICFLAKGRAPILLNKLKHNGLWNNHPKDAANLAKHVGNRKEQPFHWQVVNLEVPATEWHDAPILYITAEANPKLTDEEKKKLRQFTDSGGTIFLEASCANRNVVTWIQTLAKELWPEWELDPLPKDHALYSSDTKLPRPVPLLGMSDGIRTFLFVSNVDVSCQWNTMAVTKNTELFDLGTNLYVYSSDHRPLRARLAGVQKVARKAYVDTRIAPGKKSTIHWARVKHGGDWYTGRNYDGLGVLAASLATGNVASDSPAALLEGGDAVAGAAVIKLEPSGEMDPSALEATKVELAYFGARQGMTLSDAEATAMKKYLQDGGLLFVEAIMGDKRADAAWRALAGQLGLKMLPVGKTDPLLTGQLEGATGYPVDGVKYRFSLREERIGKPDPELYRLVLGDKTVGVYSPFDVTYCQAGYDAWGCRGYESEDALALATNIVLLATAR
jgi:hypothetical protein